MNGTVEQILKTDKAGEPLVAQTAAQLQAGKGMLGDRYYLSQGTFSEKLKDLPDAEITLIELEEILAFNTQTGLEYSASDFRRNIVTNGVRLNDLVDQDFTIGAVTLKGIRLCEPCGYLANILGQQVLEQMMHKAGLRAQILVGGEIRVADSILS